MKFVMMISFFVISCLDSCDSEQYRHLGKLSVRGIDNVSFNIYQENSMSNPTAIEYSIVDGSEKLISKRFLLTGTLDYEADLQFFFAGSYDSIVYLAYIDSNEVYALHDLKTGIGYPVGGDISDADSLFAFLSSNNKALKAEWHR